MFWVMMYMLFMSTSAAPELSLIPSETTLRNAINDPERLEQALAIRGEAQILEEDFIETIKERYSDIAQISPQYDTDIELFRGIFDDLDENRSEIQAALMEKRFLLKEQTTEKEWQKVYGNR